MLHLELKDLSLLGADLAALGFTAQELARALSPARTDGLTDEDEVPDVAAEAVSVVGDIWCLGAHRVGCGDCTDAARQDNGKYCVWDNATGAAALTADSQIRRENLTFDQAIDAAIELNVPDRPTKMMPPATEAPHQHAPQQQQQPQSDDADKKK